MFPLYPQRIMPKKLSKRIFHRAEEGFFVKPKGNNEWSNLESLAKEE
jgi:hypothetical protein